jgi:hypothetical protein
MIIEAPKTESKTSAPELARMIEGYQRMCDTLAWEQRDDDDDEQSQWALRWQVWTNYIASLPPPSTSSRTSCSTSTGSSDGKDDSKELKAETKSSDDTTKLTTTTSSSRAVAAADPLAPVIRQPRRTTW